MHAAVSSPPLAAAGAHAVLEARRLTKVYRMGEVEVHARRGVDLDKALQLAGRLENEELVRKLELGQVNP